MGFKESETVELKKSLTALKIAELLRRIQMVETWGRGIRLILARQNELRKAIDGKSSRIWREAGNEQRGTK